MSWAFPREKFGTGYVLDCDDFNANMTSFVQEVDGNLNEQNFKDTTVREAMLAEQAADDIGIRLYSRKEKLDPTGLTSTMVEIPQTPTWTPIDGTLKRFVTPAGKALVIISFQVHQPNAPDFQSGLNFAIELDGVPQMNSLLGTGDSGNDYMFSGEATVDVDVGSSPSVRCDFMRYQVKGTYTLSPGIHTVRLVARNLFVQEDSVEQYISQREVIVLYGWC